MGNLEDLGDWRATPVSGGGLPGDQPLTKRERTGGAWSRAPPRAIAARGRLELAGAGPLEGPFPTRHEGVTPGGQLNVLFHDGSRVCTLRWTPHAGERPRFRIPSGFASSTDF